MVYQCVACRLERKTIIGLLFSATRTYSQWNADVFGLTYAFIGQNPLIFDGTNKYPLILLAYIVYENWPCSDESFYKYYLSITVMIDSKLAKSIK